MCLCKVVLGLAVVRWIKGFCWKLQLYFVDLAGVSPGEGTGATMSDDDDDQADSETNLFDGGLDGTDTMGFGPLVPTESERSLMERVRQELKHELKHVGSPAHLHRII